MKRAKFTIEFLSHCLASSVGPDGKRDRFERDSIHNLVFHYSWWFALLSQAINLAGISGVRAHDIQVNLSVKAPTQLYNRPYGSAGATREHETIMPGTKVVFDAAVADTVDTATLTSILEAAGRFIGLSPFGHKMGYGRFNVLDVRINS